MAWRLAQSLVKLREQINNKWPKRSKLSDGTIGDTRHQASKSDHNPLNGVVHAFDITRDPVNGPDLAKLIPLFLADKRTKYVIYDKKIYNPTIQAGGARPYTGVNAHKQHLHISVSAAKEHYDSTAPWQLEGTPLSQAPVSTSVEKPVTTEKPRQTLKKGMTGGDVPVLQLRLRELGFYKPPALVDGIFGKITEDSLKAFQASNSLVQDGICGPLSWAKLSASASSGAVVPAEPAKTEPSGEQTTNYGPKEAIKLYQSLGWSKLQAAALVANLIWESGGNQDNPDTIRFEAHGDKDANGVYRSHGAGQWNDTPKVQRFQALEAFATKRGKTWTDPETQLLFLDHELHTTERKAGVALRAAITLEEAVAAAIQVWRPSVPHADRRLAIAKALL